MRQGQREREGREENIYIERREKERKKERQTDSEIEKKSRRKYLITRAIF